MAAQKPIPFEDIPGSERARKFEGKDHGAGMSFYISRHVNDGEERLQQVSIHPAPEMQQEDLEAR